jgi:hypothetical protein
MFKFLEFDAELGQNNSKQVAPDQNPLPPAKSQFSTS